MLFVTRPMAQGRLSALPWPAIGATRWQAAPDKAWRPRTYKPEHYSFLCATQPFIHPGSRTSLRRPQHQPPIADIRKHPLRRARA